MADEQAQFEDYHCANGSTFKDWQAALRTWLRNSAKFARRDAPRGGNSRQAAAETPYQRSMRERVEAFAPAIARKAPSVRALNVIEPFDVEVRNVAALASR